jgi:hypothetical protein
MIEWIMKLDAQALAALFSALAATAAAYTAWKGPITAARIAEAMRQENDKILQKHRIKLNVFGALMEGRSAWYSPETVNAFNLIDIAFIDNTKVRDAWAALYVSLDENKRIPEHEKQTRFRNMLKEMADDLGLSTSLRLDDFDRVYFPNALQEEQNLKFLQRKESLRVLMANSASPSANTTAQEIPNSLFPPPPKSGS